MPLGWRHSICSQQPWNLLVSFEWCSNDAQGRLLTYRLKVTVGMVVISNPLPICLSWLLIPNNRVIANIFPWHAQLDVFLVSVVGRSLGTTFCTIGWSTKIFNTDKVNASTSVSSDIMIKKESPWLATATYNSIINHIWRYNSTTFLIWTYNWTNISFHKVQLNLQILVHKVQLNL